MTKSVSAVGFVFEEKQSDMIDKKLSRIGYAEDLIVDLILRVKHDFDFGAALNKLMDVLDTKVKKEKDKIQEKK